MARAGKANAEKALRPERCELKSCGKKLRQSGRGRARRFCNAACSYQARTAHSDDEAHGAGSQKAPAALKPPPLPTWRPRAEETDRLPERPPQTIPSGGGQDPLRAVITVPTTGEGPIPRSNLMQRFQDRRSR